MTLALGIGATTAIFSVVNAVLLSPLPYAEPDQLIRVWSSNREGGVERDMLSAPDMRDFEEASQSISNLVGYFEYDATMKDNEGNAVKVLAHGVTPNFFDVLGVSPIMGRAFASGEGNPNDEILVVISHALWRSRPGEDPNIVGRTITIEGGPVTVIGVAPPDFDFPGSSVAWMAMDTNVSDFGRGVRIFDVFGRLRPGADVPSAQGELDVIADRLETEYPGPNTGFGATMAPLQEAIVGDLGPAIIILFGAAGVLLLIACANVANLLLARASARSREMSLRSALGAGRWRITRQLLTESIVLAGVGTIGGLILAYVVIRGLSVLGPAQLRQFGELSIDPQVLLFALGTTLFTGFLFGLAPAVRLGKTDLRDAMNDGGRGSTSGAGKGHLRTALVISELALAVILVVGSGLLIRSFSNLTSTNPGFNPNRVLAVDLSLPFTQYQTFDGIGDFYLNLLKELEALPGVQAVAAASSLPMGVQLDYQVRMVVDGRPTPQQGREPRVFTRQVAAGFFSLMGIPVIRGRGFDVRDNMDAPGVAIINEATARRYFQDEDPIGKTISGVAAEYGPLGKIAKSTVEIVGIVGDVKYSNLAEDTPPSLYFPLAQAPFRRMTVTLKTRSGPLSMVPDVRARVASLDPNLALGLTVGMDQIVALSVARERFSMLLLTAFGIVALVLASIGVYGVISYGVAERTGEMGIRLALGAQPGNVRTLVLGQGMVVATLGVGAGLIGAWTLRQVVASQLHELSAADPWAFGVAALLLSATAFVATYIPAVRASNIDPIVALRPE
jgi:putative ABC transport system permease protein